MRNLSLFFFYTYIGLILVAGFWGAFFGADWDQKILLEFETDSVSPRTKANILTQYRFLRALELGYGVFSVIFRHEIFTVKKFNYLFLFIMFSGVLARLISLIFDGVPSFIFFVFMIYELAGAVIIYLYTKKAIKND